MPSKKSQPKKAEVKSEPKITDIIHEMRDGVMMDVFMSGEKEIKAEKAKEE
ncbi:MAG: hypothetical protein UW18_C0015G0002 [Microgenomates group bacterium GW2011_GWF1_44_10]|nr:MAG: hypothetical protein UW18_C0015G0002 [Microgenomates group bacterium GW2011_GWF1_44_10]